MNTLKISIITPSFNMGNFIEENIKSVLNQTYTNYEHIIIDAKSVDETITILKKYPHIMWISESDNGQSEAYNKGIKISNGDLILCLNADDYLLNEKVFENVIKGVTTIDIEKYSAFMGNLDVVNVHKEKIGEMKNRSRDYQFDDLLNKLPVVIHPATFFIRDILNKVGGFDEKVHYVMDYDIFLKCAKEKPIHSINVSVSALRRHDTSKGEGASNWKFSYELIKIRKNFKGSFFNKVNLQPLKVLFYKFIIGNRLRGYAKNNKILYSIAKYIGFTKINELMWYEKDT